MDMDEEFSYGQEYRKRLDEIMDLLRENYGEPEKPDRGDPLDSLVKTILSQNTNDTNRDVAKERLDERFDSYREVLEADREEVEEAVRPAGLGPSKADRIQEMLDRLDRERGELSLDHVSEMDTEEAMEYLQEFSGVGPKTAAVTLCFVFDRPVMPVDTHVHRLSQRLRLVPDGVSRAEAQEILTREVPDWRILPFHLNLIRHGREFCTARSPDCQSSFLADYCVNCPCREG